jgi:hypothetical protein
MSVPKISEFVTAREFAARVQPTINVFNEESFGDFTVHPSDIVFNRDTPLFTYTTKDGREVFVGLENFDAENRLEIMSIYTRMDGDWWGVDSYEICCLNYHPIFNLRPAALESNVEYPRITFRWDAGPGDERFGKLEFVEYELAPNRYFYFSYGPGGEYRHVAGDASQYPMVPESLIGERSLLGTEIPWAISIEEKAAEILEAARFKEFLVSIPIWDEERRRSF